MPTSGCPLLQRFSCGCAACAASAADRLRRTLDKTRSRLSERTGAQSGFPHSTARLSGRDGDRCRRVFLLRGFRRLPRNFPRQWKHMIRDEVSASGSFALGSRVSRLELPAHFTFWHVLHNRRFFEAEDDATSPFFNGESRSFKLKPCIFSGLCAFFL